MNNSLGSLLNPLSQEQVAAYYSKTSFVQEVKSHCIGEYPTRCAQSLEDSKHFSKHGMELSSASEQLFKIIDLASKNFNEHRKDSEEGAYVDVMDSKYRVYGLDPYEMSYTLEPCFLCGHEETGGKTFRIINLKTKAELECRGLTAHLFKVHHYLAKPGSFRLEPSKVCNLLK